DLFKSSSNGIEFELRLDNDLPRVPADAGRLRQVINNLVKNAIEASTKTTEARVRVCTHLFTVDAGTYVEIRVEDHGEGINEELSENIFEPYVTNKTRGTGLGLAIVKKIIEEHGGIVSLENNPDIGAAAIIRLPIEGVGDTLAPSETRNVT
ncbi:MAG TPA: two-component sensor histidine kinase, partial [Gammaproteobacteria bacterium]|nr:two-component sensor histidine kinase [Gammaproteobacteria bacterium]